MSQPRHDSRPIGSSSSLPGMRLETLESDAKGAKELRIQIEAHFSLPCTFEETDHLCTHLSPKRGFNSEKFCASQERVSGFPEKGADLRGSPGNFLGSPGNFRGSPAKSLGNFRGNPWIAVKFHSERTSGEVAEKLPGRFGELLGKSGDFPETQGSLTPSQRLAKLVSNQ